MVLWTHKITKFLLRDIFFWLTYLLNRTNIWLSYLHLTAGKPPTNADHFLCFRRVWSGKNFPLCLKSLSIPDQLPLHPRWIPDAYMLKSRFSRPTPILSVDQSWTTKPRPIPDASSLRSIYDQPPIRMPENPLPVSNDSFKQIFCHQTLLF